MPFKSKAQMNYFAAKKPELFKEFKAETRGPLPDKVKVPSPKTPKPMRTPGLPRTPKLNATPRRYLPR